MKLAIGTVQFGMDYGINKRQKPSLDASLKMLDYATQNGVDMIDTAQAYGNAEEVVGAFLARKTLQREKMQIGSKLLPNILDGAPENQYKQLIERQLTGSLSRLNTDYLDFYLLHSARYIHNPAILEALYDVKEKGLARKVGVSIYEPSEAAAGLKSRYVDIMQFPFSILDQRMAGEDFLSSAYKSNVTLHSRSAFLQGLLNKKPQDIPKHLNGAVPLIQKIDAFCIQNNVSRVYLAMAFVKSHPSIERLVFGVHDFSQLKEDIDTFNQINDTKPVLEFSREFTAVEQAIIMPSLWKTPPKEAAL